MWYYFYGININISTNLALLLLLKCDDKYVITPNWFLESKKEGTLDAHPSDSSKCCSSSSAAIQRHKHE